MHRRNFVMTSLAAPLIIAARKADMPEHPVVRTTEGMARGFKEGGAAAFLGLRYGASTAGKNRFRPATPPERWEGVRDFVQYGERSPQPVEASAQTGIAGAEKAPTEKKPPPENKDLSVDGEDCLRVNVWTPSVGQGAKLPVLLWLHGGGFRTGSAAATVNDGARLAAGRNVVVVSINHRLGVFGHLMLDHLDPAYADSGNNGMLDIVVALRWIKRNVAAFGGDPSRVTIFGESGGGAKVCALMAMPPAQGLFSGAISQSGGMLWGVERNTASQLSDMLLEKLGVDRSNLAALADIPFRKIQDAADSLPEGSARTFAPVIGGSLPDHPFANGAPAISRNVPFILGTSRDEATVLVGAPPMFSLSWEALRAVVGKSPVRDPDALIAGYRALYPAYSPSDIFFAIMSQYLLIRSSVAVAQARAALEGANTWMYSLEWRTSAMGGKLGAPHGLSVPLAFDNAPSMPMMLPPSDAVTRVSSIFGDFWTSFAANGKPTSSSIVWPRYSATGMETLLINTTPSIVSDPRGAERRLLQDVPWFDVCGAKPRPAPAVARKGAA